MKKAVMYGAGNIGRGFIGQLFFQSGYEVVFIDVNKEIIKRINRDKSYKIEFVSDDKSKEIVIENIRAINGNDKKKVAKEISEASIMATAVGVNILPLIVDNLINGIKKRWIKNDKKPLNIIICENLIDSDKYLKNLIEKKLNDAEKKELNNKVGFIEASIGRMVPVTNREKKNKNILEIRTEEYSKLPVDKEGFVGQIPDIINMIPFSPFEFQIQKKLFIHNMGHAITAYLGYLKGYEYIWEAIKDEKIRNISKSAMLESAKALSKEHQIEYEDIKGYVDDLIKRFANKELMDTIIRVGQDLDRKLSYQDRLVGALYLCNNNQIIPKYISIGIAAALHFEDPSNGKVAKKLKCNRIKEVLKEICNIKEGSRKWDRIILEYKTLKLKKFT